MKLKGFLIVLLAFQLVDSFAQSDSCTITLCGRVIDNHDQQPLPFATLFIKETQYAAVSDSAGNYCFPKLCKGKYSVKCSHIGCDDVYMQIDVGADTVINFFPEHHSEQLNTVTILGSGKEKTTQASSELSGKELDKSKGLSLGEAMKEMAGVNSLQTGSNVSKPVIHGMHSNRILILNNGIRQEGQQWGSEHAPEIDPFIANNITVVKGASSVKYGPDAIGGVILIEPGMLRDSLGVGGEINVVGLSNGRQGISSMMVEGNLKRIPSLSWRLQGSLKRGGNIRTPNYYLKNTGLSEKNFSAALGLNKKKVGADIFYSQFNTDVGIFSGAHIGNLTDLQNAFEMEEPLEKANFSYAIDRPFQQITHELFKLRTYLFTGKSGKISLVAGRQFNNRLEFDKDVPSNPLFADSPQLAYTITTYTTDLFWDHFTWKGFKGSIGVSGIHQANTYQGRFFIPNYYNRGYGVFAIERWKKNKLELEGGIRFDTRNLEVFKRLVNNQIYNPLFDYKKLSGTIGGIYRPSSDLSLAINAGTGWRAPAVNELFSDGLHHGAAAIETGDENLVPEQAYSFSVSSVYKTQKINFDINLYYNIIDNYIYLSPELPPVLTIRGAFPAFRYQQADATFRGIDAFLQYNFNGKLSSISKASVLRAFNPEESNFLVMMPSDRFEQELSYNFKDIAKIKKPYAGLSLLYVAKQWRVDPEVDFAPVPESYSLLNFESGFSFVLNKLNIDVDFSIQNLLNTRYRDYMDRLRYFSDAPGRSYNLRIKIPFEISTLK